MAHRQRDWTSLLVGIVGVAAAWFLGQPRLAAEQEPADRPVGKVAVTAKGAVSLDGTAMSIGALKGRLNELGKRGGEIWYYREKPASEPPVEAMQVLTLIAEQRLPISFSTKPDFSDVLMPDGSTQPRPTRRP